MKTKARVTFRDDDAPHQIRVFTIKNETGIYVSCTCRASKTRGQLPAYDPMGIAPAGVSAFDLYDDPENHVMNKGVEFNPGDRTKQELFYVEI